MSDLLKRFSLLLVIAGLSGGCTAIPTPIPTPPPQPTQTPTLSPQQSIQKQYPDLVVGFLQVSSEGGWRAANTASFKETADYLGIQLKFHDAQNNLENQRSAFRSFIADPEINVIVLVALDTSGWNEILQEAREAGKVVIVAERRIDAPEALYATYIGSDFVEQGRKAAIEMCKLLEGSQKNVVELAGRADDYKTQDRSLGFRQKIVDCGITLTQSNAADGNALQGKQVMETFLKERMDIQGVFAQSDEMGLGAAQAILESGLDPGDDIKIITIGASAGVRLAMLAGDINVTVEYNIHLAPQVYEAALKALNGETLPQWIPSSENVFSQKDLADMCDPVSREGCRGIPIGAPTPAPLPYP